MMKTSSIQRLNFGGVGEVFGRPAAGGGVGGKDFSGLMAAKSGVGGVKGAGSEAARKSARELVATALINPLLAQMQKDPFKTPLFHGGQAEEMFQQQLNQILADNITAKADLPVVDAVYRRLVGGQGLTSSGSQWEG